MDKVASAERTEPVIAGYAPDVAALRNMPRQPATRTPGQLNRAALLRMTELLAEIEPALVPQPGKNFRNHHSDQHTLYVMLEGRVLSPEALTQDQQSLVEELEQNYALPSHNNLRRRQQQRQEMEMTPAPQLLSAAQLQELEQKARPDTSLRRHRIFWRTLEAAKRNLRLNRLQLRLLHLALRHVKRSPQQRAQLSLHRAAQSATRLRPLRLSQQSAIPSRDSMAPRRNDDWLPKLRPTMTDSDSGED